MRTHRITNLADASTAATLAAILTDEGHTALWLQSLRSGGLEVVTDAPREDLYRAAYSLGVVL